MNLSCINTSLYVSNVINKPIMNTDILYKSKNTLADEKTNQYIFYILNLKAVNQFNYDMHDS